MPPPVCKWSGCSNPAALQLRAMNMTYEAVKERGALMVIPSGMVESGTQSIFGLAAAGFKQQAEGS